jgi:OHCU decarboxylase
LSGDALARLNALPAASAEFLLREVCGAPGWAESVVASRPFVDRAALQAAAEAAWDGLGPDAWVAGFESHPRIGEDRRVSGGDASAWSRAEQAGMGTADNQVRASLTEAQRDYERRFGWTYIVCATGRTAEEMRADAHARLGNEPEVEIAVAAGEERRIGRLRLEKLLAKGGVG